VRPQHCLLLLLLLLLLRTAHTVLQPHQHAAHQACPHALL
jgi:hypothetical protein